MPIQQNANDADDYIADDIDARPEQSTASSTVVLSGWDNADALASSTEFPTEVKFEENKHQVFKFLDENGPFAIYKQHFLKQKTSGKRSYVCLGADCPLCVTLQDRPENKRAFSVVSLNSPEGMKRQMLIAGARLYQALHAAHYSPQGPLTKGYWSIVRTGKGPQTMYAVQAVKARDLDEDWSIDQDAAEVAVESAEVYTRNLIKENSYAELAEIAEDLKG